VGAFDLSSTSSILKKELLKIHSYLSALFISAGVPNGEFPEILIARFYCTWFFCWGDIVREINVSRAWDPVHAGDKALTRETPAKRGRVNRYGLIPMQLENRLWTTVVLFHCCTLIWGLTNNNYNLYFKLLQFMTLSVNIRSCYICIP
jgi:hypothetical protein